MRVRKIGLIKAVYQNGVLKSKRLKQVKTNLWAYSEDGGPLTDNVVFTATSGSSLLSVQRFFGARCRITVRHDEIKSRVSSVRSVVWRTEEGDIFTIVGVTKDVIPLAAFRAASLPVLVLLLSFQERSHSLVIWKL